MNLHQKKALTKKQIKDDHQKVAIRLAKKNVLNPNPISVSIPTEVGPSKDVVVQTKYGQIAQRAVMESLYENTEIFGEVLDTWSDLLNHQELERDFGNSPYRLFLKVGISTAYLTSTLSNERKYEKFKENFHDSTNGYKKILNIKDIDMVC
uniref:Uncharacterized protein n=1 Tax=Lactuca sativa TaxID=4236 RepID=A0A9R1WZM8_LACSA|nr:hypothetical protein LSAT_V11C800407320 [Lactuca sativa]